MQPLIFLSIYEHYALSMVLKILAGKDILFYFFEFDLRCYKYSEAFVTPYLVLRLAGFLVCGQKFNFLRYWLYSMLEALVMTCICNSLLIYVPITNFYDFGRTS